VLPDLEPVAEFFTESSQNTAIPGATNVDSNALTHFSQVNEFQSGATDLPAMSGKANSTSRSQ